eukprot:6702901-Alexandrium_andersonii.AAC.1
MSGTLDREIQPSKHANARLRAGRTAVDAALLTCEAVVACRIQPSTTRTLLWPSSNSLLLQTAPNHSAD